MKKWFLLIVLVLMFIPSISSAEIPKHIPNYYWQTDFEVINEENQLVRVTDQNGPSSPNGGDLYFVKNLSINMENSPLVRVFFEFSNNKFSAIVINVYDKELRRQLIMMMYRVGVPFYSNYEASGVYQNDFHIPIYT